MRRYLGQAIVLILVAVAAAAVMSLLVKASPDAPLIPHSVDDRQQCLTCHSVNGILPAPADHAAFNENTCQVCHSMASSAPVSGENCDDCHNEPLSIKLASGESLPLYIDPEGFESSIHGKILLCIDCHSSITGYPHPRREFTSRREYNISQYEICKKCHFDNYTKTLDSVHYAMLTAGNTDTPLCTDCHGAHDVTSPSQPRTKISQTCAKCHENIYDQYTDSVHGKALASENNYDVPICTDCHLSHTMEDPRTASFRLKSVDLCVTCHSNEELMRKYGISTQVVKTYLQDFHGASVALVARQSKDIWPEEAVCTDCHGVHDIRNADDPESAVMKVNLVNVCRRCHPDATPNFPGAWLSHYEPSAESAQLVFYIRWFYRVLIPFILVGLTMHILIDLWRVVTNR